MASSASTVAKQEKQPGLPSPAPSKRRARKVPDYLVREVIDGIPFFYKDYKKVLTKNKTFEDIMADSGLQSPRQEKIGKLLTGTKILKCGRASRPTLGSI